MDIEQVFTVVGEFGLFQTGAFILLAFTSFLGVDVIWANFIVYQVDHFCQVSSLKELPHSLQKEIAIPTEIVSGSSQYSKCEYFNLTYSSYSQDDFLHWNRSAVEGTNPGTIKCDSWVYDQSVMATSAVIEFSLVCGRTWMVDLISTITIAGSLLGAVVAGSMADRFGRRITIIVSFIFKIIGAVLTAAVANYYVFLVGRFIQGIGAVGTYQTVFVAMVEFVGPAYRNRAGIGIATAYSLGYMSLSLVSYYVRDYIYFIVIWTVAIVITAFVPVFLPESPRWLLLQNRKEEAIKIMKYIADVNGRVIPPSCNLDDLEAPVNKDDTDHRASPLDLVRTPRIRVRSLVLFFLWFSVSLIFFALSLGAGNLAGDVFLNSFLLGTVEIPANLFCMWSMEQAWFGRRRGSVVFFFISGLSAIVCVPLLVVGSYDTVVTVLSMIGKAGSTAAFNLVYVYSTELFPTEVRNIGIGLCSFFARIGGMAAPYAGNSMALLWSALPSLLFGIVGLVSSAMSLLLPETLGKELPDTVAQIENEPSAIKKNSTGLEKGALNAAYIPDENKQSVDTYM